MGFRIRRSIQIMPGVRMNFSKSGIGYSAGVKGYRITQRADGRVQRTSSVPGTGMSYVMTSGSVRQRSSRSAAPRIAAGRSARRIDSVPRAPQPGLFSAKAEKELYKAVQAKDVAVMEQVARDHPEFVVSVAALAGLSKVLAGDEGGARTLWGWLFATGKDPATDPFLAKYGADHFSLEVVPGAATELGLDRAGVGLGLAELHQRAGDLGAAIDVVEQLEPTTFAALSLAELYSQTGRNDEVVAMTDGMSNEDDATALLCVFRGVALREEGYFDAARETFKEALKTKKRAPVVRHRALLERARTYEAEGKRAMARRDLERIMAEDSTYEGLADELAALSK